MTKRAMNDVFAVRKWFSDGKMTKIILPLFVRGVTKKCVPKCNGYRKLLTFGYQIDKIETHAFCKQVKP